MPSKKKITIKKQKIEMKRLESEDARRVCFSKYKTDIFSKASELATLYGAEVAVLLYSPMGKPYLFDSSRMGRDMNEVHNGNRFTVADSSDLGANQPGPSGSQGNSVALVNPDKLEGNQHEPSGTKPGGFY
ncbi:uncharacterized protein A4U43_C07F31330 [Asparagus officinalis]|uniref:MADS-box domain-containing protein n=1 Tax=Asparagus officinalis TaxID=4686 RepID=A0A5P1EG81_ASPOF|nr:agamous-like MADS-box protein AGL61 [Asparagus officinalis]ONK64905.1 uncharacterized protein A4U43_C07F31330 [Asparagus officinalis]